MHALTLSSARAICRLLTAVLFLIATCGTALAADGTWTSTAGGNYSSTSNWQSGTVASGADATADFNTLDISDEVLVTLDTNPTLGHLVFGDTNTGTPGVWTILIGGGDTITLDGTSPSITVHPFGTVNVPGVGDVNDMFLQAQLAGTNGLTKLGDGILTLSVADNSTQTIGLTGGINVNAGTLKFDSNAAFTADSASQLKTLADGTTLETNLATLDNVSVAAGATATLQLNAGSTNYITNITSGGGGATLNMNLGTDTYHSFEQDFSGIPNLNITGQAESASRIRLRVNGGSFVESSFADTNLNLDNVSMYTRTWSHGAEIRIGALSGTSTAVLEGADSFGAVRYIIGG